METKRKSKAASLLAASGPFAKQFPGFIPREQQQTLADAISHSLTDSVPCLAEAGTGVGKTLAYLVPLLHWLSKNDGTTAVISTHTIALQTQLVEKDIPAVLAVLGLDITYAVLKGRQNYLCHQEMDVAAADLLADIDPGFIKLQHWSKETKTGDIADLPFIFGNWHDVSSHPDSCRGKDCRYIGKCFFYKAREEAAGSRLLVVNHALFFTDLKLRQLSANAPGMNLIPDYDAVVFDEAHHVDETATRNFGVEWTSGRVPRLMSRCKRISATNPALLMEIEQLHQHLVTPLAILGNREAFLSEAWETEEASSSFATTRNTLVKNLERLGKDLDAIAEASMQGPEQDRAFGLSRMATRAARELEQAASDAPKTAAFNWFTVKEPRGAATSISVTFTETPHFISDAMESARLARTKRLVFVSATLATLGRFDDVRFRLGLNRSSVIECRQGSPFDFTANSLLYIPKHLPPPDASNEYASRMLDIMEDLVHASNGRAFLLFTSHRMLQQARDRFADTKWPLLVQGDKPSGRLLSEFRVTQNAVLLGTYSFWEGVDIAGDALSLVVIDKLPFAIPDTPPQRAREQRIKDAGGDAFLEWSLPSASLRLKQGFGRLLRTVTDTGVVGILDSRLVTKRYGRMLLNDLPPAPLTHNIPDVESFFATNKP